MQTTQFEPMGIGNILDKSFRMYRENFLRFLAIVAVIKIPLLLITLIWQKYMIDYTLEASSDPASASTFPFIMSSLIGVLIFVIAQTLCSAALMKSVSGVYLNEDVSVGKAYRAISGKVLTLIIASILVGLVVGVGFMLLIVPGIIFGLWFALTSQVIVLEGRGATGAMGRSKNLVSGNLGKVFGLGFILVLLSMVIGWLFQYGGNAIGGAIAGTAETQDQVASVVTTQAMISQVFSTIGEILFLPVSAAAYILLYYDLRIRKEGFDLEMLAQSMNAEMSPTETQSGDPTQTSQE